MGILPSAVLPSGASPLQTSPLSFKSMYQLSNAPEVFFSVNAKIALPFLMASMRSASFDFNDWLIKSNAEEDGKASIRAIA